MVDEGLAVGDDGVPVAPELLGHLVHGAALATHVLGGSKRGSSGQLHPRVGDPVVLFGPTATRAVDLLAAPPTLVPVQCRCPVAEGPVTQHDRSPALEPGRHSADRARRHLWVVVYWIAVGHLLDLVVLSIHSERSKEVELLALRHEGAVLRHQIGRTAYQSADRVLLTAVYRLHQMAMGDVGATIARLFVF